MLRKRLKIISVKLPTYQNRTILKINVKRLMVSSTRIKQITGKLKKRTYVIDQYKNRVTNN